MKVSIALFSIALVATAAAAQQTPTFTTQFQPTAQGGPVLVLKNNRNSTITSYLVTTKIRGEASAQSEISQFARDSYLTQRDADLVAPGQSVSVPVAFVVGTNPSELSP